MALPTYTPEQRQQAADALGINEQYLYQILRGIKFASPVLARRLHELDADCCLKDLRPGDWQQIWPELATQEAAHG